MGQSYPLRRTEDITYELGSGLGYIHSPLFF